MDTEGLQAAKTAINDCRLERKYHLNHASQARRILKNMKDTLGKVPSRDVQLSDQYAREVLGHKYFAPWLYVYSAVAGGFQEGWIPDNFYGARVVPALKGDYGKVSSLKPLNGVFFHSDAFPDIASFTNGIFIDKAYKVVASRDIKDLLFRDYDRVLFKPDNSQQGRGIRILTPADFSPEMAADLGNGLFQGFIEQHPFFGQFAPNSAATLRITTVLTDDGKVSPRASYVKFGTENDRHVQTKSSVRVSIDLKTGALSDQGYLPTWRTVDAHPTSKVAFAQKVIPGFSKCLAIVTDLHNKVPFARSIGWDVTLDPHETVLVMEWNGEHNDIKFSEATQGPCFSDLGWEKLRGVRSSSA